MSKQPQEPSKRDDMLVMIDTFTKQIKAKGAEMPGEILSNAESQLEGF